MKTKSQSASDKLFNMFLEKALERSMEFKKEMAEIIFRRREQSLDATADQISELRAKIELQQELLDIFEEFLPDYKQEFGTIKVVNSRTLKQADKYEPKMHEDFKIEVQLVLCERMGIFQLDILKGVKSASKAARVLGPLLNRNPNDVRKHLAVGNSKITIVDKSRSSTVNDAAKSILESVGG